MCWTSSKRQILYSNAYMWNLKKLYRELIYKAEIDIENKPVDTKEKRGGMGGVGRWGLTHMDYRHYI